jgi:hypothetical protein
LSLEQQQKIEEFLAESSGKVSQPEITSH